MPDSPPESKPSVAHFMKQPLTLRDICVVLFVNALIWVAISAYLGGDALGTLPSIDGFVVTNHGSHRAVSEVVWVLNLIHSGATLLLTPAILTIVFIRRARGEPRDRNWRNNIIFGVVWSLFWYWSIGSSVVRSIRDYQQRVPVTSGEAHD